MAPGPSRAPGAPGAEGIGGSRAPGALGAKGAGGMSDGGPQSGLENSERKKPQLGQPGQKKQPVQVHSGKSGPPPKKEHGLQPKQETKSSHEPPPEMEPELPSDMKPEQSETEQTEPGLQPETEPMKALTAGLEGVIKQVVKGSKTSSGSGDKSGAPKGR